MSVQPVSHQVELAIRRDKRDVSLSLKLVKAHTLVELDVFHLNQLARSRPILHIKKNFVIQTEFQLWHTRQKAAHMNAPNDLTSKHVAISRHKEIQFLNK